jgi:hypothetical protein
MESSASHKPYKLPQPFTETALLYFLRYAIVKDCGTRRHRWLRHYDTSWKVAVRVPTRSFNFFSLIPHHGPCVPEDVSGGKAWPERKANN